MLQGLPISIALGQVSRVIQNKDDVKDEVEVDALNKQVMIGMVGEVVCCLLRVRRKERRVGMKSDSEQAKPPSQVTRDRRSPEPQPNTD